MLEFAGRPKEFTGFCPVPRMLRLLEFAGRPKESTGLCPVPLMLRLLEFAGRPKESTGLCPVPLRTKGTPLGQALSYDLIRQNARRYGCIQRINVPLHRNGGDHVAVLFHQLADALALISYHQADGAF